MHESELRMQSYGASNRSIWSKKSRDLAKKQPLDLDLGFARKPRRGPGTVAARGPPEKKSRGGRISRRRGRRRRGGGARGDSALGPAATLGGTTHTRLKLFLASVETFFYAS